jgi:CheY-like chemotaxis protein
MKKLKRILLIDDSEATNFMNQYFFEKLNVCDRIDVATNGSEALKILNEIKPDRWEEEMPDLILLDIKMPVMDGFEFLENYEKLPENMRKSVITILLTTSMSETDRSKANGYSSVNNFLNKPLTINNVKELLEKVFTFKS